MATLTEVSSVTRKIIKFGSISFVLILLLRILILGGIAWWKVTHPPPPTPPTVAFGKLPKLEFPENPSAPGEYELQMPTGEFPNFSDRAKVFIMPYKTATFLAPDEGKREAAALGFVNSPQVLSEDVYKWERNSPVHSNLKMNIIDGSFEYNYLWQEDPNIPLGKKLPGELESVNETKSFIGQAKTINADLNTGETKVVYLKLSGTKLSQAVSFSEADFVKVDIFRANIDDMPVVTPEPSRGLVSALLSGSTNQRFLKVQYNYFPANYSQFATYPIKTAGQAWEDLKSKKGFIASYDSSKGSKVVVRRVYLGFYDTLAPQDYLQPIFIFTGDNDFIGYVPAIVDNYY